MFRNFVKVFEPVKNHLVRAVAGNGASTGAAGSVYEKNCVSKEQQLTDALKKAMPGITYISVQDISGGCGAMFEISVEAKEFVGLNRVKQHRLVTDSLKNEIAEMHGIRIHTTPAATQ
ncbi:bolA-like 3 [Bombyx mori]|uniref:BolA-like 3 n=1 Tax=Bombyx mori TaxID=7091 RepID=Q1HQ64_BOMMO|nr:bolA-like 3 [Bombyx mori]ABF51277.1 bolA-like 3 [Bombyx mori]